MQDTTVNQGNDWRYLLMCAQEEWKFFSQHADSGPIIIQKFYEIIEEICEIKNTVIRIEERLEKEKNKYLK